MTTEQAKLKSYPSTIMVYCERDSADSERKTD